MSNSLEKVKSMIKADFESQHLDAWIVKNVDADLDLFSDYCKSTKATRHQIFEEHQDVVINLLKASLNPLAFTTLFANDDKDLAIKLHDKVASEGVDIFKNKDYSTKISLEYLERNQPEFKNKIANQNSSHVETVVRPSVSTEPAESKDSEILSQSNSLSPK